MGKVPTQAFEPMTSIDSVPGGTKYVDVSVVLSRLRTVARVAARTTEISSCKNQAVVLPSGDFALTPAPPNVRLPFECVPQTWVIEPTHRLES